MLIHDIVETILEIKYKKNSSAKNKYKVTQTTQYENGSSHHIINVIQFFCLKYFTVDLEYFSL